MIFVITNVLKMLNDADKTYIRKLRYITSESKQCNYIAVALSLQANSTVSWQPSKFKLPLDEFLCQSDLVQALELARLH